MLRYTQLVTVLGRRLADRLIRARWITPVTARPGAIFFDKRAVHLALKRLAREGYLLSGHARRAVTFDRPKGQRPSLEEALAGVELFFE